MVIIMIQAKVMLIIKRMVRPGWMRWIKKINDFGRASKEDDIWFAPGPILYVSEQSVFVVPVQPVSVFVCPGHLYLCARDICICCLEEEEGWTLIQRPATLSGFHTSTHHLYACCYITCNIMYILFIVFCRNFENEKTHPQHWIIMFHNNPNLKCIS